VKRTFRIILKLLTWTGLFLIVLLSGCYLWVKSSWSDIITVKQLNQLTSDIKEVQAIPDNFKKTLTQVYPDIFDKGLNGHALDQLLTDKDYQPCPCRQVAMMLRIDYTKAKRIVRNFYPASLTWAVEERVSQEQCMAYYLENFDFTHGVLGIHHASDYYFNNQLENLSIEQQLELILKLKNPYLYDKKKRPELYNKKLTELKEKQLATTTAIPHAH
jgi:hypothetical protein